MMTNPYARLLSFFPDRRFPAIARSSLRSQPALAQTRHLELGDYAKKSLPFPIRRFLLTERASFSQCRARISSKTAATAGSY